MNLVILFCLFALPTKKQRCTADVKEQVAEAEQNHVVLNERKQNMST